MIFYATSLSRNVFHGTSRIAITSSKRRLTNKVSPTTKRAQLMCCRSFGTCIERDDSILLESEDEGILTLTLNRPDQRNALNRALLVKLKEVLTELKNNPDDMNIRAVVIQANGQAFCSGHDLKELLSNCQSHSVKEKNRILFELCSEVMMLCRAVPQPTIAAVHGVATAAGCQLACSTDLTIASGHSSFGVTGVNVGLFCSTPAVPLIRAIPKKIALDMLFTGRILSAQEALQFGLVSRVITQGTTNFQIEKSDGHASFHNESSAVKEEAKNIAQLIASRSGYAIQTGKKALYEQAGSSSMEMAYEKASETMIKALESEDALCGIHSFLMKETPEWKDK